MLAQIFGIGAMISLFLIYQQKSRKKMLLCKLSADLFWIAHYFLFRCGCRHDSEFCRRFSGACVFEPQNETVGKLSGMGGYVHCFERFFGNGVVSKLV